jgi:glyoxylase-like metal-dependent hydrolase (beta-lactamase superfamily II)
VQTGIAVLDHPLTALLAALEESTRLGAVSVEDGDNVVEFTLRSGETLWLALDPSTHLPAWVRWISGSTTLGDVTNTTYFTGYLPFDDIRLPVGFTTAIDWRDTTTSVFHVDSYRIDDPAFEPVPAPGAGGGGQAAASAEATPIAPGVWDVRYGGNGSAVIEFADHLTMFEAYGNEAATFARLDLANTLVPGKTVTELIVSHHHFDHSGGLRAAVSRGLKVIARRGNEGIFREMVARPAPNFPDALARNPQPLDFVPVDDHLVLEDETMRVDVYHAVGHLHMAEAVVAYVPEHRIFMEGDFTTYNWDWNWWGGAYLDTVDRYGLDPAINSPVHGIVTTFDEAIASIERQVDNAKAFCAANEDKGIYMAGCPVKYSRDR